MQNGLIHIYMKGEVWQHFGNRKSVSPNKMYK